MFLLYWSIYFRLPFVVHTFLIYDKVVSLIKSRSKLYSILNYAFESIISTSGKDQSGTYIDSSEKVDKILLQANLALYLQSVEKNISRKVPRSIELLFHLFHMLNHSYCNSIPQYSLPSIASRTVVSGSIISRFLFWEINSLKFLKQYRALPFNGLSTLDFTME